MALSSPLNQIMLNMFHGDRLVAWKKAESLRIIKVYYARNCLQEYVPILGCPSNTCEFCERNATNFVLHTLRIRYPPRGGKSAVWNQKYEFSEETHFICNKVSRELLQTRQKWTNALYVLNSFLVKDIVKLILKHFCAFWLEEEPTCSKSMKRFNELLLSQGKKSTSGNTLFSF